MNEALFAYDEAVRTECGVLCGVDEAGRGARWGGGGGRAGIFVSVDDKEGEEY